MWDPRLARSGVGGVTSDVCRAPEVAFVITSLLVPLFAD